MLDLTELSTGWNFITSGFGLLSVVMLAGVFLYSRLNRSGYVSKKVEKELVVPLPKKWVKVGNVAHLIIYPIKSWKGNYLDSAIASPLGLRANMTSKAFRDRVFLVVNSKGREMCQKQFPKMVLMEVDVSEDDQVTLSAPDMPSVTFTVPKDTPERRKIVHIMNDKNLEALDCGDEVASWLDECLEKPGLRLVFHVEGATKERRELTKEQLLYPTFAKSDIGVFQNESAYLMVNQDSVDELNKHLNGKAVTHKNFRPTVLIENTPGAFKELKWNYVRLGDKEDSPILKNGRPCDRCPMITNDTETAIYDKDKEPLKTLRTFILDMGNPTANADMKNKPVMGLRMGLVGNGGNARVSVGDPIFVASDS